MRDEETAMPYQYLEHTADLGIRAIGDTLQEAFEQGAQAMLDATADTGAVKTTLTCQVTCSAPDIPALLIEWLNELLYQAEVHHALWQSARVDRLHQAEEEWTLEGVAEGEPLDPERHEFHTEIKAATYSGLSYRQDEGRHILECVLDL